MAKSPSHKFGQIVGETLELTVAPLLHNFAAKHGLFFDKKGTRKARAGKKVSWRDMYGNTHDLDYVFERNGTEEKIGTPVAFIETAWRRYTKHSRNKAQEIQGAVVPLAMTHKNTVPFLGAILAGVFTGGAITQLRSLGFTVLYFTYDDVIKAFKTVGIDASFDESTSDSEFAIKVAKWEKLSGGKRELIYKALVEIKNKEIKMFVKHLETTITRKITLVRIIPLHGKSFELKSIKKAIDFINDYDEKSVVTSVIRYEVEVRYNNDDSINGKFEDKNNAINFLNTYQ